MEIVVGYNVACAIAWLSVNIDVIQQVVDGRRLAHMPIALSVVAQPWPKLGTLAAGDVVVDQYQHVVDFQTETIDNGADRQVY